MEGSTRNSSNNGSSSAQASSTEPSQVNRPRKRCRTSSVWDYFTQKEVDGTIRYSCTVQTCKRHFSVRCSTSTLRGHLKDHGFFLSNDQTHFETSGALRQGPIKPNAQRQRDFFAALCNWVTDAGLPFSVTENDFFKEMITCVDSHIVVPSRTSVCREVKDMCKSTEISIRDILKDIPGMVSFTTDAWSSRVYKGYLSVTMHWIDKTWCLRHVLLDFVRFPTPHNGETTSTLLFDLLSSWHLLSKVKAITTDNASDMCSAMSKLTDMMNIRNNSARCVQDIHVRCIAHVVNIAVKDCLAEVHDHISQIRALLSAIRSSVKRRDIFETTQRQLGLTVGMPSLDVPTRWSSTFTMIRGAYRARSVLNSITTKVNDLRSFAVPNEVWEKASSICVFLESAASLTECQSGSTYATLSMTIKAYQLLLTKCNVLVDRNDELLAQVAKKMRDKLLKYNTDLCSELARLAQILDPRFGSDLLSDAEILRRHVVAPSPVDDACGAVFNTAESPQPQASSSVNFMETLLNEDSLQDSYDDEVVSFLRATSIGDKRADPFEWWRSNERRYPTIAPVARDVLAIQASSVCSEEYFSVAGNLVTAHRSTLSDDSIRSSMLLRAWNRLLGDLKPSKSIKPVESS